MNDLLKDAKEELKRVDHLIYVSLKYTRTCDVIHNVIERLISSFDFVIDALLKKAQDEKKIMVIPNAPKLKCELLEQLYDGDEKVIAAVKEYLFFRVLSRSEYGRESEYRRHVAMVLEIEGKTYKIDIDIVTEYYKRAKENIEYIETTYNND
jgi:hypothetical protein